MANLTEAEHQWAAGPPPWDRLSTGEHNPHETMFADSAALRAFMAGMHQITYTAARQLARVAPELSAIGSLVDIGGGTGAFAIAMAEQFPVLRAAIYDLPPVAALATRYIENAGLQTRVRAVAGDFWRDPLPGDADAFSLGFILHDWDEAGGDLLLAKTADAAAPGAILIVGEQLLHPDRTGPLQQDVNMLVSARGRERTEAEYGRWIGRHGFELQQTYGTAYGKHYLIARRR